MTAIAKPRNTNQGMQGNPLPSVMKYQVAGGEVLYQGTLAMIKNGYLYAGAATTGALGVGLVDPNAPDVDNSDGADGDITVAVYPGVWIWNNSTLTDLIAQADVGNLCYIVDNQTVAKTDGSSTRSIAGTIVGVDARGVLVYSNFAPGVDGTALAAAVASIGELEDNLASTSLNEGASLIGINDAGSLFTATTVEAALQELIGGARIATVADNQLTPGVPLVLEFAVPDAASGHTDYVISEKFEVTEVVVRKDTTNGGAGDTVQIGNGATAITDAMSLNINAKTLVRAGTIDSASAVIAAAGTLRITWAKSTNVKCQVTIFGIHRA